MQDSPSYCDQRSCRKRCDIVIVNYKSTDCLEVCLSSIYRVLGDTKAKIFVEDNGSDSQIDRLKETFPEVFFNKNRINLGFAKAVNQAVRRGRAPYLVLLNPDTVVGEGFFHQLIAYMEDHSDVGAIGAKVLERDGSTQRSARSFPTPSTALFGRSSFLSKHFPENRFTRKNLLTLESDGMTPMEVDWVSGACMMVRRRVFEEVGPLDEHFFMYWEDADWCKRMWQKGWKVVYLPCASIVHLGGVSSEQQIWKSIIEFHWSSYRFFEKHSRSWSRFLKPLVMGCLFARLVLVVCVTSMSRSMKKPL
jgi:GT2 family glycosyltransferase